MRGSGTGFCRDEKTAACHGILALSPYPMPGLGFGPCALLDASGRQRRQRLGAVGLHGGDGSDEAAHCTLALTQNQP